MLADSQGRGQIIWPIAQKLFRSVMLQQRPRWTGGRLIPVGSTRHAGTRPNLPWDTRDRPPKIYFGKTNLPAIAANTLDSSFALCVLGKLSIPLSEIDPVSFSSKKNIPGVVHEIKPLPATVDVISGISKDQSGAVLPSCRMCLFRVDYDSGKNIMYTFISSTISDSVTGAYSFNVNNTSKYRVTADDSGGTVAGITLNTLTGV